MSHTLIYVFVILIILFFAIWLLCRDDRHHSKKRCPEGSVYDRGLCLVFPPLPEQTQCQNNSDCPYGMLCGRNHVCGVPLE